MREERLVLHRGRVAPERYAEFAAFAATVDHLQERPAPFARSEAAPGVAPAGVRQTLGARTESALKSGGRRRAPRARAGTPAALRLPVRFVRRIVESIARIAQLAAACIRIIPSGALCLAPARLPGARRLLPGARRPGRG